MGLISNGTTIFDAGALNNALAKGAMSFIKKLTASSSATLSFVHGSGGVVLDGTFKEYVFTFNNIHPATGNQTGFEFNVSIDGGSNYNVAKTTTFFQAYHEENGGSNALEYLTAFDLAQGTGFQTIGRKLGNANDESCSGTLHLFNPSSTTFVKHFLSQLSVYESSAYSISSNAAGYVNTTSAINAVQFKMPSGNVDAGDICLYGIA